MDQITVQLRYPGTKEARRVALPAAVELDKLIPALVDKLGLPTGQYSLRRASDKASLPMSQTLATSGIVEEETLYLEALQQPAAAPKRGQDSGLLASLKRRPWLAFISAGLLGAGCLCLTGAALLLMFNLQGPQGLAFGEPDSTPTPISAAADSSTQVSTAAPLATSTPPLPTQTPAPTNSPTTAFTPTLGVGSTRIAPLDGMTMVYVPAGEFKMGSTDGDEDEAPLHTVYLDAFWIDQTEITNAMFAQFVADSGYQTDNEEYGSGAVYNAEKRRYEEVKGADWQHPTGPSDSIESIPDHPAVHITWNDAAAYCEWAGRRLPSEAEWEKAARGTDGRIYPWGNREVEGYLLNFGDASLFPDNEFNDLWKFTAPVGSYPDGASPYGVLDMAGNVTEWANDWYSSDYYSHSPDRNPTGPTSGKGRVLRGSSWNNTPYASRCARRGGDRPDIAGNVSGFRCALSAQP